MAVNITFSQMAKRYAASLSVQSPSKKLYVFVPANKKKMISKEGSISQKIACININGHKFSCAYKVTMENKVTGVTMVTRVTRIT